ncbi:MAG: ORF6N domain-containing protein [Bacilli bacterium]
MKNEILELNKENIKNKIHIIRNQKVMLDSDLAEIYGYETKNFNRQVKNNIEKFDEDFMFRLTDSEIAELSRCKNFTSMQTKGIKGGRVYNPYAFTEQGIYMLMTVLKGELAIKQSKTLIRLFKEMKDFILENNNRYVEYKDFIKLSNQVNENTKDIRETKENVMNIMKTLTDINPKEILILNGQKVESNLAYQNIYEKAKSTIYIIDNYINLKTLVLLKNIKDNIEVIIFTDNINNGLHNIEYNDFINEYSNINITFKKTNNKIHDRYIILDYNKETENLYHCGASSKDSGNRITTITKISENNIYHNIIDKLLLNKKLILI